MALRVGELYALLKLEDRDFQRGLQRAEQETRRFGRSLEDTIKRLDNLNQTINDIGQKLTTRITLPLAGLSAYLVKTASDAEQTEEKFHVSFGAMGEASLRLADQLARDQQRARVHLQNMMADAQAILAPMTENREAAAQMSAALAALAVDLGSFMNMADREAFDRLISGLLGSTEATERLGISLRESVLQLEAQRLGLEVNVATLGDAEKIMLRFSAIMRQSADAQTDAIRTGASFENQLKALQADVADLAAEIGQELLPYALALVQVGRDLVQHWRSLSPEAKELAIQLAAIAAAAGPVALALSAVVRAAAGVGRALSLVITFAKSNPWLLLATLAATWALSLEEVRQKLEELGRAIGLGPLIDELEALGAAFNELMAFEVEFDLEGASAAALERQKQLYQQAIEEIQRVLREGFQGAAELAEDGAGDVVARVAEVLGQLDEDEIRILRGTRVLAAARGEMDPEEQILEEWLRAQERALIDLIVLGLGPADEAYQRLYDSIGETAQRLRELREQLAAQEEAAEQARRAAEATEQFYNELVRVNDVLMRDLFTESGALAYAEATARALGNTWGEVESLDEQIRSLMTALHEYQRLGLAVTETEVQSVLDMLRELSAALDEMRWEAEVERLNQRLAQSLAESDVQRLIAAVTGDAFDEAEYQWRAVERAIWDVVRAGQAHGRSTEEIMRMVDELVGQYGHLAAAAQEAFDPLAEIRGQLASDLGPSMAIQRLIAPAFDALQYEIDALTRAISRAVQELDGQDFGAIFDQLQPEIERLQELQRLQQRQLAVQDAVNSALDGFVQGLADSNRVVQDFMRLLRWEQGGLRFDVGGLWSMGANLLAQFVGILFSGGYQRQPDPRTFAAPDPYQYGLAMARGQRSELEAEIQRLEQRLEQAEAAYDALFSNAIDAWWHSNFRQDLIRERQAAVDLARQELENARRAYEAFDLTSFLGLDPANIAQTIESGFDMADLSRLGESLENVIRTALVRAWVTSEEMVRLQESFRDLLNEVVDEFIETGDLRAGALDQLRTVIAAMEERGEAFAEVLKELGFTTEELNEQFSRMIYNIPQGYRVERAIFEAAPPRIPALATGGIVTRPTLALVGEAGPEAVVPLDGRGFGTVNITIERMDVQDGTDFGRRLDEELRRRGLVAAGNVTAWRGRR